MAILATARAPAMLYLGCLLFGLGVGNTTSLPGLLDERRSNQHHRRAVVRQTPWVGSGLGAERSKRWRYHYRTAADLPYRTVRFCLCDCIGIRIHARHPYSGSYRDAPSEAGPWI